MTDWRNAGRSLVDEWWARQPSLPQGARLARYEFTA